MRRKAKKRLWVRISMVLIAVVAVLIGYYLGFERSRQESEKKLSEKEKESLLQPQKDIPIGDQERVFSGEIKQPKSLDPQEYCARVENDIRDFFLYLDKKSYIRHLNERVDSYAEFKQILGRLSSNLPVPAGDGIDSAVMTKNIFHVFRTLSNADIRLVKEITINESETLELNLEVIYRWLVLGNQCPDPDRVRPSFDVLYHYAGFLLNTIGGRAYLSRRPMTSRMLLSYYSLLIIHEADRKGRNTYGIDVFPHLAPLSSEMVIHPDLKLKKEYLQELKQMESYYLQKR
ncbi:MAG TPA: hypothetical protein VLK23_07660 [Thermodesulfobacteriota bacterium]|nr:hypothetical protein [Thermodesulfobacteriota bacterium]